MPSVTIGSFKSPGVFVTDELVTNFNTSLAVPTACYMFGTAGASGTDIANTNALVAVTSEADFIAKFGNDSLSLKSVRLYFANHKSGLYFINVAKVGARPTASEIKAAMTACITEFSTMGVLIAPEFFAENSRSDYATIAGDLAQAAKTAYSLTFLDAPYAARATVGADVTTANSVRKFASEVAGSRTHAAVFFPYLLDTSDTPVAIPPSPAVAAIALRVWGTPALGIRRPPAGVSLPISGITGVNLELTRDIRDVLNPESVNCITHFRNAGYVIYGSRTLNSALTFINTQTILNVQAVTLRDAFESIVFETIDSRGELFLRASEIAEGVMYSLWDSGALTGATPSDAYRVICDDSNNTASQLKSGILVVDIYQSPAGTVETVIVVPHRVEIGQINESVEDNE